MIMKKILIIVLALTLNIAAYAQSGKSIYNKYSDEKDVNAVYISPAMFRIMGGIPDISMGKDDVNLSLVIKDLNAFYLIDSENKEVNESLKKDIDRMLNNKFEMLMEVKSDGTNVHLYTVGDEKTVTNLIMTVSEEDECVFMSLEGSMPREELTEILTEACK